MQALQFINDRLSLNTIDKPTPVSGQALVRSRLSGICNTDIEILKGYHDFSGTLGHEFVGEVMEAGNRDLLGKRVVCDINAHCGLCAMCLRDIPHHCLNRRTLGINHMDGAFADYLLCPEENLIPVPENVPDEIAVFCEPVAASLQILEQLQAQEQTEIAVIGDGKLGILICFCLLAAKHSVHLVGRHDDKLILAHAAGANIHTTVPSRQFPVVVEASGNPSGFDCALQLTEPCGTLVLKSTYADSLSFDASVLVVNEVRLLGSRCGPMHKALELLAPGGIDPRPLIQKEYPLSEGVHAMQDAASKGSLKVLIRPA